MNPLHNTTGSIRTFTGQLVNVLDPDPDTIKIDDIAHGLSNICRFNGQTREFYSVAQHCYLMAEYVAHLPIALTTLLHDASEAYLLDIPRPVKHLLPQYQEAETKLMLVIAQKFGFQYPLPQEIIELDTQFLEMEYDWLMLDNFAPHTWKAWAPAYAKQRFLTLYKEIIFNP